MTDQYYYIGPIAQLLSMSNLPEKGAIKDEELKPLIKQGILFKNDKIEAIGDHEIILKKAKSVNATIQNLTEDFIALPGFIDSHTHICFAGSRAGDYAMRNSGKSYLEIAKNGGGIWDTVTQTRKFTQQELVELIVKRANILTAKGITTIEVKSGYGLTIDEELKMLRAIKEAQRSTYADLIPTCLAAHIIPREYKDNAEGYLKKMSAELFPIIKEENLTNRIDAFIEEGAFSSQIIRPYLKKAQEMGFDITIHADQFHTGGSQVAVQFNAVSADHLEASTEKEIRILAESNTVATALPGATLGLGCAFTPARQLLDNGATLAIASDWNPGSAPMGDLLTQAAILGTFEKLSNAEIISGITNRAAKALNINDIGILKKGTMADVILFKTDHYNEILYKQGKLVPAQVFKNGKLVIENETTNDF